MKNKISYSNKIGLFILFTLSVLLYWVFVLAETKKDYINLQIKTQSLKNNSSTIHFNAWGNNFWGGALWISTQKKLETPKYIQTPNGSGKYCSVKIEGLYYNSQRGERLRPLDENSLVSLQKWGNQYDSLKVNGGLYTSCGTWDQYSIYGNVEHILNNNEHFYLAAGVNYDIPNNRMKSDSALNCTLQLVNNITAVGYLYDFQWGIGFVGGNVPSPEANKKLSEALSNGKCISDIFKFSREDVIAGDKNILWTEWTITDTNSFQNQRWTLAIRWIVGLTNNIFGSNKTDIEGSFWKESQTVRTSSVSLANAVNIARKKSEQLCKWKWNKDTWNVRCFNNDANLWVKTIYPIGWVTYIFKDIDAQLSKYMNWEDQAITIFVDGGKLLLPGAVNTWSLKDFDSNGYLANPTEATIKANYLKGNFIINGILSPAENTTWITNKLHVHGKLLSFNTFDLATEQRENQISSLLKGNFDKKFINYRDLFTWRCGEVVEGLASDGTNCGKGTTKDLPRAPLSVIDMQFSSPLTE